MEECLNFKKANQNFLFAETSRKSHKWHNSKIIQIIMHLALNLVQHK